MRYREPAEVEDEGIGLLLGAMAFLKPAADADSDEQSTGDYEAYAQLETCIVNIRDSYNCRFCGAYTGYRDGYCSKNCYKTDSEGW